MRVAIAGVYEHPGRVIPELSVLGIRAHCAGQALVDAGLAWSDVDALYDAGDAGPQGALAFAEYLRLRPDVLDTTAVGGSSFEFHVAHAVRDIQAGRCRVALLTYGSRARTEARAIGLGARADGGPATAASNLESPFGLPLVGGYAMIATRHMAVYGTLPEQLAEIVTAARYHALRNPAAVNGLAALRKDPVPLEVADVLAAPRVADPLGVLDCCLINDGGGAVVLVAEDVVPGLRKRPVWVLATGEAVGFHQAGDDLTVSAAAQSGHAAFGRAGLRPEEMDVAMLYDSFSITVLTILEDLGFCPKGEGGGYVEGGRLRYDTDGGPAVNPDGGGLSSNHPGMRGIFLLVEATRQLRGEATAQVPDARLAVAHGCGGHLNSRHSGATVILAAG